MCGREGAKIQPSPGTGQRWDPGQAVSRVFSSSQGEMKAERRERGQRSGKAAHVGRQEPLRAWKAWEEVSVPGCVSQVENLSLLWLVPLDGKLDQNPPPRTWPQTPVPGKLCAEPKEAFPLQHQDQTTKLARWEGTAPINRVRGESEEGLVPRFLWQSGVVGVRSTQKQWGSWEAGCCHLCGRDHTA